MSLRVSHGGASRGAAVVFGPEDRSPSPPVARNAEDAEFLLQFSSFLQQFVDQAAASNPKQRRQQLEAMRRVESLASHDSGDRRARTAGTVSDSGAGSAAQQQQHQHRQQQQQQQRQHSAPGLERHASFGTTSTQRPLPSYMLPTLSRVLAHYSNEERDTITLSFQPVGFHHIKELPDRLQPDFREVVREKLIRKVKDPLSDPGPRPWAPAAAHIPHREPEYVPQGQLPAEAKREIERTQRRARSSATQRPLFRAGGARFVGKHESPFDDGPFPYLGSPARITTPSPPRTRGSVSRPESQLSRPGAVRVQAAETPAASDAPGARSAVVARALAVMLRHDVPVDCAVRVNQLGYIVMKLVLPPDPATVLALRAYMDDMLTTNQVVQHFRLQRVPSYWNLDLGTGALYCVLRPPWVEQDAPPLHLDSPGPTEPATHHRDLGSPVRGLDTPSPPSPPPPPLESRGSRPSVTFASSSSVSPPSLLASREAPPAPVQPVPAPPPSLVGVVPRRSTSDAAVVADALAHASSSVAAPVAARAAADSAAVAGSNRLPAVGSATALSAASRLSPPTADPATAAAAPAPAPAPGVPAAARPAAMSESGSLSLSSSSLVGGAAVVRPLPSAFDGTRAPAKPGAPPADSESPLTSPPLPAGRSASPIPTFETGSNYSEDFE